MADLPSYPILRPKLVSQTVGSRLPFPQLLRLSSDFAFNFSITMSLFRSWLQNRPLQMNYELPLWQKPDLDASVIPPPIVTTSARVVKTPNIPNAPSSDEILVLQHKEKNLHQTLQQLLDAQAEGLIVGLSHPTVDDVTSNGSVTPTISSVRSQTQSPLPPPSRRKLGLRDARRALYRTILDCATLKDEEGRLVQLELDHNEAVLGQIYDWEDRRNGLQKEIKRIEHQDNDDKIRSLQEDASRLQTEIEDMELRLSQMKNRYRQLLHEIKDLENSVQSQLSSFKSSLTLLESNIQDFLARPPITSNSQISQDPNFLSLPPKRRTLEMAKDYWQIHSTGLEKQSKSISKDRAALEEGAVVWKAVVEEITSFERYLRERMQHLDSGQQKSPSQQTSLDPSTVLSRMERTIRFVGDKLSFATSKKWKLLVCCIGAELEALRQGKELLEDALVADDDSLEQTLSASTFNSKGKAVAVDGDPATRDDGLSSHTQVLNQKMYDTDDEGPDPDIMLSRQRSDTG